jgi:TfoX/Sxy family transcriptional regulator of competence genes
MAYDETLADRVRAELTRQGVQFVEKRMMGGLCLMVAGKMCLGILGDRLMVRLDPAIYEEALTRPGCGPMDFTGRPMRGFVFVTSEGMKTNRALKRWIDLALEFNPRAASSKTNTARRGILGGDPSMPKRRKNGAGGG